MGRGKHLAVLACLLGTAIVSVPSPADACSCMPTPAVCEEAWTADAVLNGEVIDVAIVAPPPGYDHSKGPWYAKRVRLRVETAWRGSVGPQAEVYTTEDEAGCGFPFEKGEKYLVYAHVRRGRLVTTRCGRTKPLSTARADLEYLRQPALPSLGGRITGNVVMAALDDQQLPAAGYTVRLRANAKEWTGQTDGTGRFEITGVPAGKYDIAIVRSDDQYAYGPTHVTLADARGCAEATFTVVPNGRIAMKVIRQPGDVNRMVRLDLVEADALSAGSPREQLPYRTVLVSDSGEIEWGQLRPGRYLIGINISREATPDHPYPRAFYPGVTDQSSATVLLVGLGDRVEVEPFTLPAPLRASAVHGTVARPDGQVVAGVTVDLMTEARRYVASTTADPAGRFTLTGLVGSRYRVRVITPDLIVESNPFELTPATAPILIVVRSPK